MSRKSLQIFILYFVLTTCNLTRLHGQIVFAQRIRFVRRVGSAPRIPPEGGIDLTCHRLGPNPYVSQRERELVKNHFNGRGI